MPIKSLPTAKGLAAEFCNQLALQLSGPDLAEAVRRNTLAALCDVCHTHDFCDANMVMYDAWHAHLGEDMDLQNDAHIALWNNAWRIAKAAEFSLVLRKNYKKSWLR